MSCLAVLFVGKQPILCMKGVWYILYATPQYLECLNDSDIVSGNLPWTANSANVRQDVECERRVTYRHTRRII